MELSLSTREGPRLRDELAEIGFTIMSAESRTNPGGYTVEPEALEQFEIDDTRGLREIKQMLLSKNMEPVMKDWEELLFE